MTLQERNARIKIIQKELEELIANCPHDGFFISYKFMEAIKNKDHWFSEYAICIGCDMQFGWLCQDDGNFGKPCIYTEDSDGFWSYDCVYCGMPKER